MRFWSSVVLGSLGALWACGPRDVYVEAPGNRSGTILVAVEGSPPVVWAADASGPVTIELDHGTEVTLRAAVLTGHPDELGIHVGVITSSDDENARPMPSDTSYFEADLRDGDVSSWSSAGAGSFHGFRVPPSRTLGANCEFGAVEDEQVAFGVASKLITTHDDRLVFRGFGNTYLVETERLIRVVTVTATRSLTVRAFDTSGLYFTDGFGELWRGTLDEARLEVTPTRVRIEPRIDIEAMVPTDRPGRFIVATGTFVGPLENGRFTETFECDCTALQTAVTTNGRVFVAAGINLLELVDGELMFRTLIGGNAVGLHAAPNGSVVLMTRAGFETGTISVYDPAIGTIDEAHRLDREGALVASAAGAQGISYVVVVGEGGDRKGAVRHFVPGFGPCADVIHQSDTRLLDIARLGDSVATVGGPGGNLFTFISGSL